LQKQNEKMRGRQYNQRLTPKKAAEGIQTILHNARALLSDAQILFDNNKYERATALSILAIEEAGKVSIIRSILVENNQKELNKEWKRFRSHNEKNWGLAFQDHVDKATNTIEDFRPLFDNNNQGQVFDQLKQLSIYTDLFKNGNWSSPDKVITKEIATSILSTAKLFIDKDEQAMTTEEELTLWVKHLKPVWKKDMLQMKQALINCYNEAEQTRVLAGSAGTKEMIEFLL
jgi:AbiV family abortive infection protein